MNWNKFWETRIIPNKTIMIATYLLTPAIFIVSIAVFYIEEKI